MTGKRIVTQVAIAMTLAFLGAGCAKPAHQEAVARRQDNLNATLSMLAAIEASRPAQLDATSRMIAERHQQDVANSQHLPAALEQALREEFERFDRQSPQSQREIQRQIEGNTDNIEQTLPHVLY